MADIAVTLTLDDKQFITAVNNAKKSVADLGTSLNSSTSKMSSAFGNVRRDMDDLKSSTSTLSNGFKAIFAAIAVDKIIGFADSVTTVNNRLKLLSTSQEDANNQFQAMTQIATNSRASLSDVTDLYYKMASSADQVGISQKEAAQMTQTITKAMAASGISAAEASGGILQLGQAFASGKFQGDELRSILEAMPPVAKALADSLGVPVGALKNLGAEGKITSRDFVDAMKKAGASVDEAFGKTAPTISQAFEVLKTKSAEAFNQFDKNSQVSAKLSTAIINIADALSSLVGYIDMVATPLKYLIEIFGAFWIGGKIIQGIKLIGAVFSGLATTIGTVTSAVSSSAGFFGTLINQASSFGRLFKQVGWFDKAAWTEIGSQASKAFGPLPGLIGKAVTTAASFIGIDWGLGKLTEVKKEVKNTGDEFGKLSDVKPQIKVDSTGFDKLMESLKGVNAEKLNGFQIDAQFAGSSKLIQDQAKAEAEINERRAESIKKLNDEYGAQAKGSTEYASFLTQSIAKVNAEYDKQVAAVKGAIEAQASKAEWNKIEAFSMDQLLASNQRLNDIENERAKIGLSLIQQKYLDIENAARKAAEAQIAAVAQDTGVAPSQVDPTMVEAINQAAWAGVEAEKARVAEYEKQNALNEIRVGMEETLYQNNQKAVDLYKEMNAGVMSELQKKQFDITAEAQKQAEMLMREQELRTGILLTEEQRKEYIDKATESTKGLLAATEESYNQSREWSTGWQTAMQEYVDNAGNYANTAKEVFSTATKGMEEVLFNFVKTGKFTWDDFLQSMLDMLLKVAIEKAFAKSMGGIIDMIGGAAGALANSGGGGGGDSGGGGWMSMIGAGISLVSKFFADGGNIQSGSWGIVGEAGPELIKGPASIKPLKAAGMHSSANLDVGQQPAQNISYVTYNINATDAASFREMIAADPSFIYGVSMQGAKGIPSRR